MAKREWKTLTVREKVKATFGLTFLGLTVCGVVYFMSGSTERPRPIVRLAQVQQVVREEVVPPMTAEDKVAAVMMTRFMNAERMQASIQDRCTLLSLAKTAYLQANDKDNYEYTSTLWADKGCRP